MVGNNMQEGVTDPRQESNRKYQLEEPRVPFGELTTVNEEVNLGQDDDLPPLERIHPS